MASSIRRLGALVLGVALALATPGLARARDLEPLMHGWEQHLSITWNPVQQHGRTEIEGYVINRSPYRFGRLRVLVDSLDDAGRIVDQRVSWVHGELPGDSRLYFEVPVKPASNYRVSVFSYDRLEEFSMMLP